VGCRLHLVGRSPHHRELARRLAALEARDLQIERGGRSFFADRLVDDARPSLDLEALARGADPPGLLARRLLALEEGAPEGEALLREARERVRRLSERLPWAALEAPSPAADEVREHLRRAGERAIEELLAGRDGA
jgi:hypothetical protein